jgi:hypothetical protein
MAGVTAHGDNQGYFCDGTHWNAIPEAFSQTDANWNGVSEPFFPGIGGTNTCPSPTKFWVTMRSRANFLYKNSTGNNCFHINNLSRTIKLKLWELGRKGG